MAAARGVVGEPTRVDHLGPRAGDGLLGLLARAVGAGGCLLDLATRLVLGVGDVLVGVLLGPLALGRDVLVGLALGLGDHLLHVLVGLLASATYVVLPGLLVASTSSAAARACAAFSAASASSSWARSSAASARRSRASTPSPNGVASVTATVASRAGSANVFSTTLDMVVGSSRVCAAEPADQDEASSWASLPGSVLPCDAQHIHRRQGRG